MGEVSVDGQGFGDFERVHHHEAQAVHEAVVLVMVLCEVGESRVFLVSGGSVYATQNTGEELLADADGEAVTYAWIRMAPLSEQRDGLRDDMVGGEEEILQAPAAKAFEDILHPAMIVVPFYEQREEEAGVEEDQSRGSP